MRRPLASGGRSTTERGRRRGFTLIELLVVILIILLVSAVALPTVLPALNHRQVSEAARILQGALVGARDKAIHDGEPSGIRLMPDPAFYFLQPATLANGNPNPTAGLIDPTKPLAYNRAIPIGPAPEYTEGLCIAVPPQAYAGFAPFTYQLNSQVSFQFNSALAYPLALMLVESAVVPGSGAPNPPTSWYWNIRVGDKVQINNAGPWYTVVGPVYTANPEGFVNVGTPGALSSTSPVPILTTAVGSGTTATTVNNAVEYLLLVNGQDDNKNGWTDEGLDNVDNDGDGVIDEPSCKISAYGEWEQEAWSTTVTATGYTAVTYTIRRRPAPLPGGREIILPTAMVIDATTGLSGGSMERSRLPIINADDGTVDIVLNPDGTVLPTTTYSSPSSFGLGTAFFHFWLADRQDVVGPNPNATAAPYLPIAQPGGSVAPIAGPYLKSEYSVVTLSARTGQIIANTDPPFFLDPTLGYTNQPGSSATYNPIYPFIQAEQGVSGGP
jgi:prepilin-type N-terminal cleavage/methylation domain-containing protein